MPDIKLTTVQRDNLLIFFKKHTRLVKQNEEAIIKTAMYSLKLIQ